MIDLILQDSNDEEEDRIELVEGGFIDIFPY